MFYERGGRREIAPLYRAGRGQKFIYGGYIGYIFLKILISRFVSRVIGAYLDSPLSRMHIKKFIRKNGLDMSQFDAVKYKSFNDFFTRRVKGECRPVDLSGSSFISPCDGYLSVYPVSVDGIFNIKGFDYTVGSLFKSDEITRMFMGGLCLVFRLTVKDYHRYIYLDDCEKGENVFIKGKLHTVQPVALESLKVYTEIAANILLCARKISATSRRLRLVQWAWAELKITTARGSSNAERKKENLSTAALQ